MQSHPESCPTRQLLLGITFSCGEDTTPEAAGVLSNFTPLSLTSTATQLPSSKSWQKDTLSIYRVQQLSSTYLRSIYHPTAVLAQAAWNSWPYWLLWWQLPSLSWPLGTWVLVTMTRDQIPKWHPWWVALLPPVFSLRFRWPNLWSIMAIECPTVKVKGCVYFDHAISKPAIEWWPYRELCYYLLHCLHKRQRLLLLP